MKVYRLSIDEIKKLDIEKMRAQMPQRMERADRYKHENDRLLCIGGGYLIWNQLGISDEKELKKNEYGKLYADGYPDFSISHSGDFVVYTMAEEDSSIVGIDIELIRERNLSVSKKVFTPAELEWMKEDELKRFHILWTRKESVMKALGMGFSLPFTSFETISEKADPEGVARTTVEGQELYIRTIEVDGYMISVCSSAPIEDLNCSVNLL